MPTKASAAARRKTSTRAREQLFATPQQDVPLPRWASAEGRPPLQPIISYVDRLGIPQRLQVVAKHGKQDQDIELNCTIDEIRAAGGTNLVANLVAVKTGITVWRWKVA